MVRAHRDGGSVGHHPAAALSHYRLMHFSFSPHLLPLKRYTIARPFLCGFLINSETLKEWGEALLRPLFGDEATSPSSELALCFFLNDTGNRINLHICQRTCPANLLIHAVSEAFCKNTKWDHLISELLWSQCLSTHRQTSPRRRNVPHAVYSHCGRWYNTWHDMAINMKSTITSAALVRQRKTHQSQLCHWMKTGTVTPKL